MKLARKLTLALVAGMAAVLAVHAVIAVRREIAYSDQSMRSEAHFQGKALVAALDRVRHLAGPVEALQLIDDANEPESGRKIRWVWLNAREGEPHTPRAPRSILGPVALGAEVTWKDPATHLVRTYVPAPIESGRPGAIEVSQTTTQQDRFVRSTIRNHIFTTLAMAGVCAAMAMLLGGWFVGGPIRALVHKARRVGAGDLSGPLILAQRDEIRVLADEMNAMCERLGEAQANLEKATAAQIAALEQLRHADRLMTVGKLASGIAHELGTPLNVVNGRARMIAGGDAQPGEVRECAHIIVEQTAKMTNIIRQLLDFARRRGAQKSPQDLAQLVRQTALLLTPLADKKAIEIAVVEPETDALARDLTAEVDTGQMQQALTNLIVNAIQAMRGPGKIQVAATRSRAVPPADHGGPAGEYLCLSVADQGEGMSADTIGHIFEPFFTTKPVGEGTGLGLSVTYGIVQEHGGWVAVDSEPGQGSRFSIYLPAVASASVAAAAPAEAQA
jgi:two-component system, NtrC family, sensor kinase